MFYQHQTLQERDAGASPAQSHTAVPDHQSKSVFFFLTPAIHVFLKLPPVWQQGGNGLRGGLHIGGKISPQTVYSVMSPLEVSQASSSKQLKEAARLMTPMKSLTPLATQPLDVIRCPQIIEVPPGPECVVRSCASLAHGGQRPLARRVPAHHIPCD